MTKQGNSDSIEEHFATMPLGSGLSQADAEKLTSILLSAVAKCREVIPKEDLDDQQFIRYIVGATTMAAMKFLEEDRKG